MKILKVYEIHLNLTAAEVYSGLADPDFLITQVRKRYEGRCMNSTLIIRVMRIIQHSDIYCTKNRVDGSSDLDIMFEAEAVIYGVGVIIPACEIKKVENTGQMICTAENAVVRLEINRLVQALGEGAIVPVKVTNSAYTFGKREITVTGEVYFHPTSTFILYKLVASEFVQSDLLTQLKIVGEKIQAELNNDIVKTPSYSHFMDMFYPWKSRGDKGVKEGTGEKGVTKVLIQTLVDALGESGFDAMPTYLTKYPKLGEDSGSVYVTDADPAGIKLFDPAVNQITFVVEKYEIVLYNLLSEHLNYLTMLRHAAEIWDTPDKLKANKKTWDLYFKRKH